MANEVVDHTLKFLDVRQDLTFLERGVAITAGLALAAVGAQPRPNKVLSLVAVVAGAALAIRGAMPGRSDDGSGAIS